MGNNITSKYLRNNLKDVVHEVREAQVEYNVYYRSLPAFKIIPIKQNRSQVSDEETDNALDDVGEDSIDSSKKGDPKFDHIMKRHGRHLSKAKRTQFDYKKKRPSLTEIREILSDLKDSGIDLHKKGDPKFDHIMKKHG